VAKRQVGPDIYLGQDRVAGAGQSSLGKTSSDILGSVPFPTWPSAAGPEDHGSPVDPVLPVTSRFIMCSKMHQEAVVGPLKQPWRMFSPSLRMLNSSV